MRTLLLISCLVLLFSGCKKDRLVNDVQPVSQYYYLSYNVTTGETKFRANFSHPTSHTLLPSGYSVTVNDSSMTCLQNSGANPTYYYTRTDSGNGSALFKLRRADGTILQNFISNNAVAQIDFDSTYSMISKSDTLKVAFVSDSLHIGEAITVTIFQDPQHYSTQQLPLQSGDSVVIVLPLHMNNLITGPATLTLTRTSPVLALMESDTEGSGTGSMRASVFAEQQVTILP